MDGVSNCGVCCWRMSDNCAIVGYSKTTLIANSISSFLRSADIKRIANKECPPNSKKSS